MSLKVEQLLSMVSELTEQEQTALHLGLSNKLTEKGMSANSYNDTEKAVDDLLSKMALKIAVTPVKAARKDYKSLASSGGSPSNKAYLKGRNSFVRRGQGSEDADDVFGPSIKHRQTRSDGSSPNSPPSAAPSAALTSTNWRGGESTDDDNENDDSFMTHATTPIDSRNAQAHFLPNSCVFVANLLCSETEQNLEVAVTKAFGRFGHVYVKIRRDPRNMPYAFCQYTSEHSATRAINEGKGLPIHGRFCRVERAKANTTYFLSRKDGSRISIEEASKLLKPYGSVESIAQATEEPHKGRNGLIITFMYYDGGKDAAVALRESQVWSFSSAVKGTLTPTPITPMSTQSTRQMQNKQFLQGYDEDRRSIFVGNLSPNVTEAGVRSLFSVYGHVKKVQIVHRSTIRGRADTNNFAFVEFGDHPSAIRAVSQNNTMVHGNIIRVNEKRTSALNSGNRFSTSPPVVVHNNYASSGLGDIVSSVAPPRAPTFAPHNIHWNSPIDPTVPYTPFQGGNSYHHMMSPPYSGPPGFSGMTISPNWLWNGGYNQYPNEPFQQYAAAWGSPSQPPQQLSNAQYYPANLRSEESAAGNHGEQFESLRGEPRQAAPALAPVHDGVFDENTGGAIIGTGEL